MYVSMYRKSLKLVNHKFPICDTTSVFSGTVVFGVLLIIFKIVFIHLTTICVVKTEVSKRKKYVPIGLLFEMNI